MKKPCAWAYLFCKFDKQTERLRVQRRADQERRLKVRLDEKRKAVEEQQWIQKRKAVEEQQWIRLRHLLLVKWPGHIVNSSFLRRGIVIECLDDASSRDRRATTTF